VARVNLENGEQICNGRLSNFSWKDRYKSGVSSILFGEGHMKPITEPEKSERPLHPAFEKLCEDHYDLVYATAFGVLRNRDEARDVAQDVFLRLTEGGFSPDQVANLKGYLYTTALNEALCVLRWSSRTETEDLESLPDRESGGEHPLHGPLQKALKQLKPEVAKMLLLHYESGYTDVEIARMVRKSRLAVAMKLTRGRQRLRKLIEQEARGEQ
jgi:RNA polymerase sigma factor (sigma-70 family)